MIKAMALKIFPESRWLVRIGKRLSLSTFGAIGEEPKGGALYSTFKRSVCSRQFGWHRG